jgi:integrase
MPRPNTGPKLVIISDRRWKESRYYVRWTERGKKFERATPFTASDPRGAHAWFADWLTKYHRARRTGPSDPDQITLRSILVDYAKDHGPEVASAATLAGSIEPLTAFFHDDTVADLSETRVTEYWTWRRSHSIHGLNRVRTEVEIVDGGAGEGTIIRELAGVLRPAIYHAIKHRRLVPGSYHIKVPQTPPGRDYWITRSEAARLLWETRRDKRARLHLPLYTLIALYAGQRRGAILDLVWQQVDLVHGRIDFNPPVRIQTNKPRPRIPVPRSLLAALKRARRRATRSRECLYGQRR